MNLIDRLEKLLKNAENHVVDTTHHFGCKLTLMPRSHDLKVFRKSNENFLGNKDSVVK